MKMTELNRDQRATLKALVENPGLYLRDIHQALVDREETRFQYSPDPGTGWNEERHEVQTLLYELEDMGFAEVEGKGKPWYPTTDGMKIISE